VSTCVDDLAIGCPYTIPERQINAVNAQGVINIFICTTIYKLGVQPEKIDL